MQKYGESKTTRTDEGDCTSRDLQFGTYRISDRLIFVEKRVPAVWAHFFAS